MSGGTSGTQNYKDGLQISIIDSERIQIYWDGRASNGAIMTATNDTGGAEAGATYGDISSGLSKLWIGPEKYWAPLVYQSLR